MPGSAIAGLYGSCLVIIIFFLNCHPVFQSGCAIVHSDQQCMSDQFLRILPSSWSCLCSILAHWNRFVAVSPYGFNLHLPNG